MQFLKRLEEDLISRTFWQGFGSIVTFWPIPIEPEPRDSRLNTIEGRMQIVNERLAASYEAARNSTRVKNLLRQVERNREK